MELVRELNEGIPRVFKEMKEAGLPEPKIVEAAANVTVILYNGKTANTSDKPSDNHLPQNLSVNLSETQQKILRMIAEKQYINATHAAEILKISRIRRFCIEPRSSCKAGAGFFVFVPRPDDGPTKKMSPQKFRGQQGDKDEKVK